MSDTNYVSLNIDGRPVSHCAGATVLEAALEAGIYIPEPVLSSGPRALRRLPHVHRGNIRHEGLSDRLHHQVAEGMEVKTYGDELNQVRTRHVATAIGQPSGRLPGLR